MFVPVSKEFLKSDDLAGYQPGDGAIVADCLFIKQGNIYHKVRIEDITHLESDNVYVYVYTSNNKFMVRSTLNQYLQVLNSKHFVRVHRSYAVNIIHIESISANHISINKMAVPTGKAYKNELLKNLRIG